MAKELCDGTPAIPNHGGPALRTSGQFVGRSVSVLAGTVQLRLAARFPLRAVQVMIVIHYIDFRHGPMPILLVARSLRGTS